MSGERLYWVTPAGGTPYRVTLRVVAGGWEATVERGSERWTIPIAAGDRDGEAWSDTCPIRYRWDPATGRLALGEWTHELRVESDAIHRVAELGLTAEAANAATRVMAPMPGLILAIEVAEGEQVEKGQGLLIIEAMKMENEIRAPVAGVVRGLSVSDGDAVERDTLLCVVERLENA